MIVNISKRTLIARYLSACLVVAMLLQMILPASSSSVSAAGSTGTGNTATAPSGPIVLAGSYLDAIEFGDVSSETAHKYKGEQTKIITGFKGEAARVALPRDTPSRLAGDITFTMKVDPYQRNYLTVKFGGEDNTQGYTSMVNINGEQVGYLRHGDYEALKTYSLWNGFYYFSLMLPLEATYGKDTVEITISTLHLWGDVTNESRPYYKAYTHVQAYLDVENEVQGYKFKEGQTPEGLLRKGITEAEKQGKVDKYRQDLINKFNSYSSTVDGGSGGKLSIVRYVDELKSYATMLKMDWSPANTPELKKKALERIFKSIDNHVKEYYSNTRLVLRGGHQGDWGGFYGALGEALYIVENLIQDDSIYGNTSFQAFLDQPFATGTTAGEFSLDSKDWTGGELTRREAWERALKANFDFARSRLSYIYNQMLYTYEGAWEAQEGLRIINSQFYEGKDRSHQILLESLGIEPFLGEEVLTGPNGEELDLYHSLFLHDGNAVFTNDVVKFVAKGLAKSKIDENGNVVRLKPYGEHYKGLTEGGQTRENSFVAGYGEAANYLLNYFYKTFDHHKEEADKELNDKILKAALKNYHSRGYTRYQYMDDTGSRVMKAEQVTDERGQSMPGWDSYGARMGTGMSMQFASLEMTMASNEDRYDDEEWAEYWNYAREAVGYSQQQLFDNQLIERDDFGNAGTNSSMDYRLTETYAYLSGDRGETERFAGQPKAGVVLPHTDFDYYTEDELAALDVKPEDYKQFAWADIDNLYVSVKDDDFRMFGNLMFRLKGIASNGRIHVVKDNYNHVVQLATNNLFQYEDTYLRPSNNDVDYMSDSTAFNNVTGAQNALIGEVLPIAYQPGLGKVNRDGLETDTPYAGYPDLQTSRYGKYFMIFNTTRDEYGNKQNYDVELPADFSKNTVLDLVSGKNLPVVNGKVMVPSKTAMVLKLTSDIELNQKPYHVDFVSALVANGYVGVSWKTTSGGKSYTIKRSESENGNYETIAEGITGNAYEDRNVTSGKIYFYKVAAVNDNGAGWDSWRARADLTNVQFGGQWLQGPIGNAQGSASVDESNGVSSVVVDNVNGKGFGNGDDFNLYKRDIPDSLQFVHQLVNGNNEASAKLENYTGEASGIMMRESLEGNARYVYFGTDESGKLVLRTRTRVSLQWNNQPHSPFSVPVENFTAEEYPYIKLVRHHDSQSVLAFVSKEGQEWIFAAKAIALLPNAYYSGLTASDDATFTNASVHQLSANSVLPFIARTDDQLLLQWSKPKQVSVFNLYKTTSSAASTEEIIFKPGTTEPVEGSPWSRVITDARVTSYQEVLRYGNLYYKILPIGNDGTLYPIQSVAASADSIDSLLEQAEGYQQKDYTRKSYYLFRQELDRIKSELTKPGADLPMLVDQLYVITNLLVPLAQVYLVQDESGEQVLYENQKITQDMVIASANIWSNPAGTTDTRKENGWRAFDGDLTTSPDTQTAKGWVQVDLGEGNAARIDVIRYHPKSNTISRINGGIVQGSVNGTNWVNLFSINGITQAQWYAVSISDQTPFRYFRYFDNHGGYTNVAELELYKKTVDSTLIYYLKDLAAEAKESAIYTDESYLALNAAIDAAVTFTDQADADAKATVLADALNNLQLIPGMPILKKIPDQVIGADQPFQLQLEAYNASGKLFFNIDTLPDGAVFNGQTGQLAWTPGKDQGGIYQLTFTVKSGSLQSKRSFKLTVVGEPTVPANASAVITAKQQYKYTVEANDKTGRPITIKALELPVGAKFDTVARQLTWTPGQADYGKHQVQFEVSNGSFTVIHTLSLNVELNILPEALYTKGSHSLYKKEVERIEVAMKEPGADKTALAVALDQAEKLLAPWHSIYTEGEKIMLTQEMVNSSDVSWYPVGGSPQYNAKQNGWLAFDGDINTSPDTKTNPGSLYIDFGTTGAPVVEVVKFLPRAGGTNYNRMNNAKLEGSNDGSTYTMLHTFSGITQAQWSAVKVNNSQTYRYLRYTGENANVAELQFFTAKADKTLLQLLVDKARAINTLGYTPESMAVLLVQKGEAEALMANSTATQPMIDNSVKELNEALEQLVPQGMKMAGPSDIFAGDVINVDLSLINVTQSVYAGSLTLNYNTEYLQYIGVVSANERVTVSGAVYNGSVKITVTDAVYTGDVQTLESALLNVQFKANPALSSTVTSSVYLSDILFTDGAGVEWPLLPINHYEVRIDVTPNEADLAELRDEINIASVAASTAVTDEFLWGHYKEAVVSELASAISQSKTILDRQGATKYEVRQAAERLKDAVTWFVASVNQLASDADLVEIAHHYGISSNEENWNSVSMYDFNGDGLLDIIDLSSMAKLIVE